MNGFRKFKFFLVVLLLAYRTPSLAQAIYGTTGLLRMPTADMQKDKTFMFGGSMIDHRTLSKYWSEHNEYKPYTFDYYINITFFPWLEVGYTCTLVKGLYNNSYWPQRTWGKFTNQDRSFHGRLRLWKEGWWKSWTPQIVLGANDPGSHSSNGGGDIDWGGGGEGNHNYLTRYFLAATKHMEFANVGVLGVHAAWIKGRAMSDVHYNRPSLGANFQFALPANASFINRAINGFNLMAEICPGHNREITEATYDVNVGCSYTFWKDHVNLMIELDNGKYFACGVHFKAHL